MSLDDLLGELGYRDSPFFRESSDHTDLPMPHLLRDARRAKVLGTYFIRTMGGDAGARRDRPAVHVAEAKTPGEARVIHRHLWNQGTTPFLLVSLPGQVRVYTPFAYDESDKRIGQVEELDTSLGLHEVAQRLRFLRADSIDSGEIWQTKGSCLRKDKRVDLTLLDTLRALSDQLVKLHHLEREVAHALVGRFVYLYYLREREILSDPWLVAADVKPDSVFSSNVRLNAFRRLTDAVDDRFNGRIFPIDWSARTAPNAEAVRAAGRAFAGEDVASGQMPLFRPFDFSFIPIELLSSIYEHFLHDEGKGAKEGAVYTSETVADYLLAEVESIRPLERGMKVLDPCCGSGIFLVLAFRRLVEKELRLRQTNKLLPTELREILTSSIFGVERNPEACLVTEFSLILALLSYIDPPELHRLTQFKFPTLHNRQIFEADFFLDGSAFWQTNRRFDCIVGNPPWVELEPHAEDEQPAILWIKRSQKTQPVARYRTSEAFTWRVRERLASKGVVGLITHAKSLTNDQSEKYRRAFFAQNNIYRITNFSNLAYVLFGSAKEPAASLVYSLGSSIEPKPDIVHFSPLLVNQPTRSPGKSSGRRALWVFTISESEIQVIPCAESVRGDSMTWKRALWGNPRDHRTLKRLRQILPKTLDGIAKEYGWDLSLGLQLRNDHGTQEDPNEDIETIARNQGATATEARKYAQWFAGLKVLVPDQPKKALNRLTFPEHWLVKNELGTYIRKRGGTEGLKIVSAPHLFLWNEYAPFSDQDFILCNPAVGIAAPAQDADKLRAISVFWASSIIPYCMILELSPSWGVGRSIIRLDATRRMPIPELSADRVCKLASLHAELAAQESTLDKRADWQRRLDDGVASILSIPAQIMLVAREFREFRLPLVQGRTPETLTCAPDEAQLRRYAERLKTELDGFMEKKARRHAVTVLRSRAGIVVTVELTDCVKAACATVREADASEQATVRGILRAAQQQFGQWVYVQRSVRVFAGKKIHVCKPARRLEWTETQALLDAADIIAEVADSHGWRS